MHVSMYIQVYQNVHMYRLKLLAPGIRATRTGYRYTCVYTKYAFIDTFIYMYVSMYRLQLLAPNSRVSRTCYRCAYAKYAFIDVCIYMYISVYMHIA